MKVRKSWKRSVEAGTQVERSRQKIKMVKPEEIKTLNSGYFNTKVKNLLKIWMW